MFERKTLHLLVALAALLSGCSSSNEAPSAAPAAPVTSGPPVVVGTAPPGAIVTIETLPDREWPMPAAPALLDQYGKQFVPGELFVRVGQPVEFRNSEDQSHNVHVVRSGSGTAVFHVSTDPSDKYVHTFDRPGRYDVSCDLHLGMAATIIATTSPYVAVADSSGAFIIRDVPPGSYTLRALVSGRTIDRKVDVAEGRTEVNVAP